MINKIGLICDIVGFVLVYYFGLPKEMTDKGNTVIVMDSPNKGKVKTHKYVSELAFVLIVIGFLLQFLSSFNSPMCSNSYNKTENRSK